MSDSTEHSRREFIVGAIAVSGGLLLLGGQQDAAAVMRSAESQLLLFDPERADACRSAEGAVGYGCAVRPIEGDRVRFASELFARGAAPEIVSGLTHYADFILLSGCAEESGYRVLSERVLPAVAESGAHGALIAWKIGRVRPRSGS